MADPPIPTRKRDWTSIDRYWEAMARKRTARRSRERGRERDPGEARATLGALPFFALMAGLAVLVIAIVIAAWPGRERAVPREPAERELGTAPAGWLEPAKR